MLNVNEKNRFAMLAYSDTSDGDSDDEGKKTIPKHVKNIVRYTIQLGSQPIIFEANDPLPYNLNANNICHSSFFNKCFYCQYMAHSQKHCPLKQCL